MRTRQEIDAEYSEFAKLYGDRLFKQTLLQEEIKTLFQKMADLSHEPAGVAPLPIPPLAAVPDQPLIEKVAAEMIEKGKKKGKDTKVV